MTNEEYNQLVKAINDLGLCEGKVMKINGQWYIEGTKNTTDPPALPPPAPRLAIVTKQPKVSKKIPAPIIKLPHWIDDDGPAIIDQI